jgi:phosphopantothenoylcysteine decarboxylase / phosphopantothenate---cysteine ligase
MRPFAGRRVLLGVTGGIACYKATWLARLLHKAGASVDVVLTRSAREFVGGITFEALTGRPVHEALIAEGRALEHIALARSADVVAVVPATADFVARAASGRADDLLTAILLATTAPVLVAPAMNDRMWAHPAVRDNVSRCRALGYVIVDPVEGDLAAGEGAGPGRLPEPEAIMAHIGRALEAPTLRGTRVLVTAGPTREPIDPVRFISNESSGRQGCAIAAAAWRRGADVVLIHGPLEVPAPEGVTAVAVGSTAAMRDAVSAALDTADILVMAAAPADFRVRERAMRKLKKGELPDALALAATPDILRETMAHRRAGATVVGFALETNDALPNARRKLEEKALDLVVLNRADEPGAGFGVSTNRVTFVDQTAAVDLPLMSKHEVAEAILDHVEAMRRGR